MSERLADVRCVFGYQVENAHRTDTMSDSTPTRAAARPARSSFAAPAPTISRASISIAPAPQARRLHGRQRVGQVLAGLRHDLRRRAAALRRVAVGLRPAVSRADGEAGRGCASTASPRRSPFARRTASATRARRSARRPRFTTICGCCGRASAGRSAASAAARSTASRPKWSPPRCSRLPEGTRLLIGFDLPLVKLAAARARETRMRRPRRTRPPSRSAEQQRPRPAARSRTGAACRRPAAATLDALRRRGFGRLLGRRPHRVARRRAAAETLAGVTSVAVIVDRLRVAAGRPVRLTDSIETAFREGTARRLPSKSTRPARSGPCIGSANASSAATCGIAVRDSAAATVLVQQPVRRVLDVPRLRQHHRARHESRRARPDAVAQRRRDRAVDQAALPGSLWRSCSAKRARTSIRLDVPWRDLTDEERRFIIDGDDDFDGIAGFFRRLERKKYKVHVRVFLSRYRGYQTCPTCGGTRLRREARDVRVGGQTIDAVCALTVKDAPTFFESSASAAKDAAVAEKVLREIRRRLGFLTRCRSRLPHARPVVVDACRAASRSASTSRHRSGPRWWIRCTSSTSRRSDCTRATTSASIAILLQLRDQGNTRDRRRA